MFYYLILFILSSFVGYLWELILTNGKAICGDMIVNSLGLCMPFLFIYGFAAMILVSLRKILNLSRVHLALLATLIITIYECIVGYLSYITFGKQTWKYPKIYMTFCSGYISIITSIYWFALIYGFYIFLSYYDLYFEKK